MFNITLIGPKYLGNVIENFYSNLTLQAPSHEWRDQMLNEDFLLNSELMFTLNTMSNINCFKYGDKINFRITKNIPNSICASVTQPISARRCEELVFISILNDYESKYSITKKIFNIELGDVIIENWYKPIELLTVIKKYTKDNHVIITGIKNKQLYQCVFDTNTSVDVLI